MYCLEPLPALSKSGQLVSKTISTFYVSASGCSQTCLEYQWKADTHHKLLLQNEFICVFPIVVPYIFYPYEKFHRNVYCRK